MWLSAAVTPLGLGPAILLQLTCSLLMIGIGSAEVLRAGRLRGMPRMERHLRLARSVVDGGYRTSAGWSLTLDGRPIDSASVERALVTRTERRYDSAGPLVTWGLYLLLDGGRAIEVAQGVEHEPSIRAAGRDLHRVIQDDGGEPEPPEIALGKIDWEGVSIVPMLVGGVPLAVFAPVIATGRDDGTLGALAAAALLTAGFIGLRAWGIALLASARARLAQDLRTR